MLLEWLGVVFVVLTLIGCVAMLAMNVGMLYEFMKYLKLRRTGQLLEQERALLAHPLPPDDQLPHVVVQIAAFNEPALIERSIANAVRLDWPKDRLHVQVCDDSTDRTTELARAAARDAKAKGFDVAVIHRDNRTGYKAGALHAAMQQTEHQYFAIFDVDYVSGPEFLRQCMAALTSDERLAFVQARPDFLNAGENVCTRAQAIMLDFHYCIELPMRNAKQAVHFNGTCGVWRRKAIELGGGWAGDTLTEDWDLSYAAGLKGMPGMFLGSVAAAGELPRDLRTWIPQQKRWAAGIGQVALKVVPTLFRDPSLSAEARWARLFPLGMTLITGTFAATPIAMVIAMLLKPSSALALGVTVYVVYAITVWVLFGLMYFSSRALGRGLSFGSFLFHFVPVLGLSMYVSWENLWWLPATLLGRRRVFVRTPKAGAAAK